MRAQQKYSLVARLFHWLTAVLVIGMIGLGVYMEDLPLSMEKIKVYNIHKSVGVCVFVITVLRILWRLRHPAPALPSEMRRWERIAAHASHFCLYGLLLFMPAVGMLHSWAANFPVVIFDVFTLPALIGPDETLKNALSWTHYLGSLAFAGLISVHVVAALKHHIINKDDVMRRMF